MDKDKEIQELKDLLKAWRGLYDMVKEERDSFRAKYYFEYERAENLEKRCNDLLREL